MRQIFSQTYRQLKYFGILARFGFPWPGRHRKYVRFVILAQGRSGSTMLTEMCGDHPHVTCFSEVFDRSRVIWGVRQQRPPTFWGSKYRIEKPVTFLNRHVFNWHPLAVRAVGIKVLFNHLLAPEGSVKSILEHDADLKVIRLIRDDAFANLVSTQVLKFTGCHHIRNDTETLKLPEMSITTGDAERFFRTREASLTAVDSLIQNHDVLDIRYETMRDDQAKVSNEICDFLGVKRQHLMSLVRPLSQQDPRERVVNMDELKRHFGQTRWKEMVNGSLR